MSPFPYYGSFKGWARQTALYEWRQRRRGAARGPRITRSRGELPVGHTEETFVVVCGGEFDQTVPNAATMSRMGWCHGFEELGVPYVLLNAFDLHKTLPTIPNPMCWLAGSDYIYLDGKNLRCLKQHRHAVLVGTCFKGDVEYFRDRRYPQQTWSRRHRERILSSEPRFLFTMSGHTRFEFYEGWLGHGIPLVSLPLACDLQSYGKPSHASAFDGLGMAFVGGYWPYKGQQFERYLKPFANHLHVFGYSRWPYGHYHGQLAGEMEAPLYAQAKVSPVINEPHVSAMGIDLNERVFKVLGAGGLAVTDATPFYREWFDKDELLVPDSLDDYLAIVTEALEYPDRFRVFRERGRQAVLSRHTYRHRAESFLRQLS